jgi:hypothetical protein
MPARFVLSLSCLTSHPDFRTVLEKYQTPAAKFQAGLKSALAGAFGFRADLAAAVQRDAGATIVGVTSTVQHVPATTSLTADADLKQLLWLQDSLMDVYTSYRSVVLEHAALAEASSLPALHSYLKFARQQLDDDNDEEAGQINTLNGVADVLHFLHLTVSATLCHWGQPQYQRLPLGPRWVRSPMNCVLK